MVATPIATIIATNVTVGEIYLDDLAGQYFGVGIPLISSAT